MNRHNLPLAWHAATDMSAIGPVMIANSSNCLISQEWLASITEGDSIINATLLYKYNVHPHVTFQSQPSSCQFLFYKMKVFMLTSFPIAVP